MKFLFALLIFCQSAFSATYYIDFTLGSDASAGTSTGTAWKLAPGMTSFAGSYSHVAGDVFIFKGGETWPDANLPGGGYNFGGNSGTSGNVDTFTGGQLEDPAWGTGYPIFDGGTNTNDNAGLIDLPNKSYIKINGIHIVNADDGTGNPSTMKSGGIRFNDSNNIEISNCKIEPGGKFAIKFDNGGANILVHHNEMLDYSNTIECNKTTGTISGLKIYDNNIHDPIMQGGDHVDGIHLFSSGGAQDGIFDNPKIYNNYFYGSWASTDTTTGVTACIYIENGTDHATDVEIYNNLVVLDITGSLWTSSEHTVSAIFLVASVGMVIANNTYIGQTNGETAHIFGLNGSGIEFENNIATNHDDLVVNFGGVAASTVLSTGNYNIYDTTAIDVVNNIGTGRTFAEWQADGYEANGSDSTPSLDGSYAPTAGDTVAKEQGTTQTVFTTDKNGVTRTIPWDIGAYKSNSVATSTSIKSSRGAAALLGY